MLKNDNLINIGEKGRDLLEKNWEDIFFEHMEAEAREINKLVDEIKLANPEMSYQEISDSLIRKTMIQEIETNEGTKIISMPFEDFRDTQPESKERREVAQKIIDFYNQDFQRMFQMRGDRDNLTAITKEKGKNYGALLNTDWLELEKQFLSIIKQCAPRLVDFGLVPEDFRANNIYQLAPEHLLLVINAVIVERFMYDKNIKRDAEESQPSDIIGLDMLLAQGSGVCRHYSILCSLIFEQIKRSKNLKNKRLYGNIFLLDVRDQKMNHAYNMAVKVMPNGDIMSTMLDPTFANAYYRKGKVSQGERGEEAGFLSHLDFSRSRQGRLKDFGASLLKALLPKFLDIPEEAQRKTKATQNDPLIFLFEKYKRYCLDLQIDDVDSYKKFEDIMMTALTTPTFEKDVRKYFNALFVGIQIIGREGYAQLPIQEREKIELLFEGLVRKSESCSVGMAGRLKREIELHADWAAGVLKGGGLESQPIAMENIADNKVLRQGIFTLLELLEKRILDYIITMKDEEITAEEKVRELAEMASNILAPFKSLAQKIKFNFPSGNIPIAPSSVDLIMKFIPIRIKRNRPAKGFDPFEFERILKMPVYDSRTKEDVPFLSAIDNRFKDIVGKVNKEIATIYPSATEKGPHYCQLKDNLLDDTLERLNLLRNMDEERGCARPIIDILKDHLSLSRRFGGEENIKNFSIEGIVSFLLEAIPAAHEKIMALAVEKEGGASGDFPAKEFPLEIISFLFKILGAGNEDEEYYWDFDNFVRDEAPARWKIIELFFDGDRVKFNVFFGQLRSILSAKMERRVAISNNSQINEAHKKILLNVI